MLAAVASFFVMARSPIGNAQIGSTFALNSITAAVLGGASLAGGRATFLGGTVAAILLALIITVLPYLGLSPDDGPMIIGVLVLIGIVLFQFGDIKELVKRNYKRARRLIVGSRPPKAVELPAFYPAGTDFGVVPTDRKLIRGGTCSASTRMSGTSPTGDVLIEGDRIVAVGRDLANGEVEVIDASGMIVHARVRRLATDTSGRACSATSAPMSRWRAGPATSRSCCTSWRRRSGRRTPTSATWSPLSARSTPGSPPCSTGRTSRARPPTPTP